MKIIITENQNDKLKKNLINIINRSGFNAGIKAVGTFNNLFRIIGKDALYDVLVTHNFDPDDIVMVTSYRDVPDDFYRWAGLKQKDVMENLNNWGPMFLVTIGDGTFLYQEQPTNPIRVKPYFKHQYGGFITEEKIMKHAGLEGITIKDVIDIYFTEE